MKSLTSLNLLKSLGIALLFVGVAPLLPVIALMHLSAWLGLEKSRTTKWMLGPVQTLKVSQTAHWQPNRICRPIR